MKKGFITTAVLIASTLIILVGLVFILDKKIKDVSEEVIINRNSIENLEDNEPYFGGLRQIRIGQQVLWTTDLVPDANETVDLGSESKRIDNLYVKTGYFGNIASASGDISLWANDVGYLSSIASESYWDEAYNKRVDTWNAPLSFGSNAVSLDYNTDHFILNGSTFEIASASYWEDAYDWKAVSESFYDTAYAERGSVIAGDNLTWNGTQLDATDTTCDGNSCDIANTGTLDGYEAADLLDNTDAQQLSYDPATDVISLTNGGSIDISEVDTNTTYSNLSEFNDDIGVSADWDELSDMPLTTGYLYVGDASNHPAANSSIFVNSGGSIGIGTTSPQALLHIGSNGTPGFIDGSDDLYIYDDLEVNGVIYGDGSGLTNVSGEVSSNSLDFDELVDSMTLDANLLVASAGYSTTWNGNVTIGNDLAVTGSLSWGSLGSTIGVTDLTAEDYGDFTCNGTTCTLDETYLTTVDISDNTNLTVGATGIELSDDDIILSTGYFIPLTASASYWQDAYDKRVDSWTSPLTFSGNTVSLDYDTDIFSLSGSTLTIASASYWEQAYDWGDHSVQNYLDLDTYPNTDTDSTDDFSGSYADLSNKPANIDEDSTNDLVDSDFTSAGLMKTDGAGNYSVITDNSSNWSSAYDWKVASESYYDSAYSFKITLDALSGLIKGDGAGGYSAITDNSTNWDNAYSWKVASESYYDTAYNERGSQIGGTGLTWDGTELDVGGLDFSEFVNSATLDADFAIASAGYSWDFGNTYITLNKDFEDFSGLYEMVNKEYVDTAVTALGASYYMTDDDSGIGDYKLCSLTPPSASESYIESLDLTDDEYIGGWISASGETPAKLLRGIYNWFVFAEKTDGNETLRLYWKLFERKSDTSEVEIATSSDSNTIDGKTSYIIPLILASDYEPASDSRIVGKLYADVSGSGGAPDVRIYYLGTSGSRWEIPANTEVFQGFFVPYSGAVKDLDLGSYDLTLTGGLFGATASISGNLDLSGRFVADTIASHSFAGDLTIGDDLTITGQISWGSLGTTIDISDNTNLAVSGTLLNLSGDTLSINEGTLTDGKICTYSSASGLVCDYTDATDDSVEASELTLDYGDFTCNGTICTLDESYLTSVDISDNTNLTVGATGIELSDDDIILSTGYFIPLIASASHWDDAYNERGSVIAGDFLTWNGSELDVSDNWWDANEDISANEISESKIDFDTTCGSGNHLYISGDDLACEPDATDDNVEASELTLDYGDFTCNGTTCTLDENYLTTVDISDDTNLSAGRSLTLNGDSIEADAETYVYKSKIAFEDPTADDDFFFGELAKDVTFTSIYCKTLVGTVDLDVTIGGSDINGTDITCTTAGVLVDNLGGDTSGAAGEELKLEISSVDSSPTYLMVQVNGEYND